MGLGSLAQESLKKGHWNRPHRVAGSMRLEWKGHEPHWKEQNEEGVHQVCVDVSLVDFDWKKRPRSHG